MELLAPASSRIPDARRWIQALSSRRRRLDAIAVLVLGVLSLSVAHRYINEQFALSYDSAYRDCTEDLLYPCVGRLGWTIDPAALETSANWQAFVSGRADSLSCDALRDLPRVSAGHFSDVQRYLHASLSAVFWTFGPRRSVYVGYMSVMVCLAVLAAYGLFRLGAGPLIASLVALPFVFSDLHLRSALHPAEYAKAPFFLGCLFLLGVIVSRRVARERAIALSAGAGVVVGLGIGFKTDVLICVPIAVAVIVAFAPRSLGLLARSAAALVFLAAVLLSGWPVLKAQFAGDWGSLFPVQVLGGMYRNFDDYYARPSLYDYGVRFDDTHVTYLINSYDQRVNGSTTFAEFYSKTLQNAATQMVVDIDRTFPSDFMLRSFAAVVNVLKLGRFGLPAAFIVVVVLLVSNFRLGACVVFLLCSAIGYVSLVFQTKHFFHLEWVPWWFTAVVIQQGLVSGSASTSPADMASHVARWVRAHARRLIVLGAVALAACLVFLMVRQLQQSRMTALIAGLMRHANDERLTTVVTTADDGSARLSVDGLGSAPHPTPLVEDYLVLDVECRAAENAAIVGVYEQATSPRERMVVPCATGSRQWTLFWPVYQYPPAAKFRWFEASRTAPFTIRSVDRVADASHSRLLLKLAVPDDYQQRQWYHVLRPRFFVDPVGVPPGS